jgi:crotonobetainyl-CoA:carnitine CoA-transferase CaiB-like acyl-CoA transferase
MTGVEGGERVRSGHSVADITAGMFAFSGILLALEAKHRTGAGQFVDVSMLDGMISAMASSFAYYFGSGLSPEPQGTRFATIVPYRGYATKDREIVIAGASQKLWLQFCDAIEKPELASNPDYATNALRVKNREVLEPVIEAVLKTRTCAEWQQIFGRHGVPCSPLRTLEEVAKDPQAEVREMFPRVGATNITGAPVKLSATPAGPVARAPKLGEDTEEVLRELKKT